jgi:D-glycero-D-manno-heptose 1,7-bisphosphate phosphatase
MRFVILDRDGVINEDSAHYIRNVEEWRPLPGSLEAIAALSRGGYEVVIVTNQSGLGRGLFDRDALEGIHAALCAGVEAAGGRVGGIFYCPHRPEDDCACRKPRVALLEAIEARYGVPVAGSVLVGDSPRDMELARAKGCTPLLVLTGNGRDTAQRLAEAGEAVTQFKDLGAVARWLLDERR